MRMIPGSEDEFEAAGKRPVAWIVEAVESSQGAADLGVIPLVFGRGEQIASDQRERCAARTEWRDEVECAAGQPVLERQLAKLHEARIFDEVVGWIVRRV